MPVLFVTVRDSEQDIVFALEHGADDYMVKPVRRQELLARVHALLRRAYPSEEKKQLSFPPFEIDIQRGEVRKDGTRIDLTPKEFELTVTLFRNIGRLLSRGHLQETVWGRTGDLATRTVDTHVSQVRKKLDLRAGIGLPGRADLQLRLPAREAFSDDLKKSPPRRRGPSFFFLKWVPAFAGTTTCRFFEFPSYSSARARLSAYSRASAAIGPAVRARR